MTAQRPSAKMREHIAETMWEQVSAHDLAHACDAVGMPPPVTADLRPMDSKRRYVRDRLLSLSAVELADVARLVAEEYDDAALAALAGPKGVHGVDGELKNLIFAAHGPKPRIVLRSTTSSRSSSTPTSAWSTTGHSTPADCPGES